MSAPSDIVLRSDDDGALQSIIRKKFEPSNFDWLTTLLGRPADGAAEVSLLQRAQRHLSTLHRVSELLAGARDLQGLSDITLTAILDVTAADRAAIVLRREDPSTGGAEIAAARSRSPEHARFTVSRALVSDVLDKGVSRFAHDATADGSFSRRHGVSRLPVRSVMCVPLRTAGEVLGALYADSVSGAGRFS